MGNLIGFDNERKIVKMVTDAAYSNSVSLHHLHYLSYHYFREERAIIYATGD